MNTNSQPLALNSSDEYHLAVERIYCLMQQTPVEGSAEFIELDSLSRLVDEYESIHFPILPSDA